MSIITILAASQCHQEEVALQVSEKLGYRAATDEDLLDLASARFQVGRKKLKRAMYGADSVLDKIVREETRDIVHIGHLRSALADLIKDDKIVYSGLAGHLLPRTLTHVLRVCLVAKLDHRIDRISKAEGIDTAQARKRIGKNDLVLKGWTSHLFGLSPWDKSLYDLVVPMDDTTVEEATQFIYTNALNPAVLSTPAAMRAMDDFMIACRVYEAISGKIRNVEVKCKGGEVSLIINEFVLRLARLTEEIEKVALRVQGVKKVSTRVGPEFRKPNIYPNVDPPQKILLVDDEEEFVRTLSERLEARNLGGAIAYNGEEALSIVDIDAPDVMVLDLKMPGIDGIEVLRRVKSVHPQTEVIILTGHGSEVDEALARELGAFAYLQKPADIDVLSRTVKEAYRKIERCREDDQAPGKSMA